MTCGKFINEKQKPPSLQFDGGFFTLSTLCSLLMYCYTKGGNSGR